MRSFPRKHVQPREVQIQARGHRGECRDPTDRSSASQHPGRGEEPGLNPAQGGESGETIRLANEISFCTLGDPLNSPSADRVDISAARKEGQAQ
jgi:hypothetical protein